MIRKASDFFGGQSKQYDREVVGKIKDELKGLINSELYLAFDSQLKIIRNYTYDKVKSDIKKLEQRNLDDVADKLASILNKLIEGNMASYGQKVKKLVVEGSGWDQRIELSTKELDSQLSTLAQNCKEKLLAKVLSTAQQAHKDFIKAELHSNLSKMPDELAKDLRESYL